MQQPRAYLLALITYFDHHFAEVFLPHKPHTVRTRERAQLNSIPILSCRWVLDHQLFSKWAKMGIYSLLYNQGTTVEN